MEHTNSKRDARSIAGSIAATVAITWISASTVIGEMYAPLKDALKESFTHHWIGKGVIAVVLFIVVFLLVYPVAKKHMDRTTALSALFWSSVLGTLAIIGYYFYADFL